MDYPLLIDGDLAGTLKVETQGLYTYIEAATHIRRELIRIWVQGGGEEHYLGLMQPWDGGMRLCRKLTRRELESFPKHIERGSDRRLEKSTVDRVWERQSDGSLICRAEGLLALPCSMKRAPYGADLRQIGDGQYLIFSY